MKILTLGFVLLLSLSACDAEIPPNASALAEQKVAEEKTLSEEKPVAASMARRPEGHGEGSVKEQKSRSRILTLAAILLAGSRR
jgi:hypothetical protein